jgi:hypothetical protein
MNFEIKLNNAIALLARARQALVSQASKDKAVQTEHKSLLAEIDALIVGCER